MDTSLKCKKCSRLIIPEFYFCPICGNKIKDKPLSIGIFTQIGVYIFSALLPPFGLKWAFRYLRQEGKKSKIIGWISVGLTTLSLYFAITYTFKVINEIQTALNNPYSVINGLDPVGQEFLNNFSGIKEIDMRNLKDFQDASNLY
jgi:hypothetical protein